MDPVTVTLVVAVVGSPVLSVVATKWLDRSKTRVTELDKFIGRMQEVVTRADEREKYWSTRDRERDRREDALLQHIYVLNDWILEGKPPPPPAIPSAVFE